MADMNDGRPLGWDDSVEKDAEFILLPEGDYDFMVNTFERGYHNGSDKMPPCNKATVHIQIVDPSSGQTVTIMHNLFLHSKTEWTLSAFFIALGLKKKGEKIAMPWNAIPGRRGRCQIKHQEHKGKTYNNIAKFYDPAEHPTQSTGYTPGEF